MVNNDGPMVVRQLQSKCGYKVINKLYDKDKTNILNVVAIFYADNEIRGSYTDVEAKRRAMGECAYLNRKWAKKNNKDNAVQE